jgi:8-oxo-dGTP pyrophosphatase MutT (NUDIX family)
VAIRLRRDQSKEQGGARKAGLLRRAERQRYEAGESSLKQQVAALPWRWAAAGGIEVLLVTSRETGRWLIPKGGRMIGRTDHRAAEIEAEEEAGVRGRIGAASIGSFRYVKRLPSGDRPTVAKVYPLLVRKQLRRWKERGQRQRMWVKLEEASSLVGDPDLARLLHDLMKAQMNGGPE